MRSVIQAPVMRHGPNFIQTSRLRNVRPADKRENLGTKMDNQHRQIKGYRELSQAEIDLMNKIKTKGAELGELVQELEAYTLRQHEVSFHGEDDGTPVGKEPSGEQLAEQERLLKANPHRWVSIGKTHLQQGLMALTRSVAQPTFF